MEIANRYNRPLYVTEYTTPGIAARIAGINILTFKKWLRVGKIPVRKNPTATGENIIRVGDILTYCIRNDLPYDKEMISRNRIASEHQPQAYVDRIYAFNTLQKFPYKDARVVFCTLRQFIEYLEYDPFNWFAIGNNIGSSYTFYTHIVEGLKPLILNAGKFKHHVVALGVRIPGIPFYPNLDELIAAMPMKHIPATSTLED